MILAYIILLILLLLFPAAEFASPLSKGIFSDYLSKDSTLPVKGFFAIIVLFSHYRGYVELPDHYYNNSFIYVTNVIGQLMVAIFFFYSGFGINESIKKKGKEYISGFLKSRLLPVWLSFAICICFYLLFAALRGKEYSAISIALAFTGWTSVGNSNWFMFDTFIIYLMIYLAFKCGNSKKEYKSFALFLIEMIALLIILYSTREDYWWNTLLCFPAGMAYSGLKTEIDAVIARKPGCYWISFIIISLTFILTFKLSKEHRLFYCVCSVLFCLIIVFSTMKIKFNSMFLSFIGEHVFSIYILQRLVFSFFSGRINNPYGFFVICTGITVLVSVIYDKVFNRLKGKLLT